MARSKDKKAQQTFTLFIVTFLVSLVVITYFIKSFSPNVDVEIGGESSQYSEDVATDSDVKQAIDDRLKWIQMEDNTPGTSETDGEAKNGSEKVRKNVDKKVVSISENNELKSVDLEVSPQKQILAPPVPAAPVKPIEPPKMTKVYVGNYPTIEAAIIAQNKLMDVSTSVSPFVKEINGVYVLQAGSYANAGTAESIAREINSLGFQARVVRE